MRPHKGASPLTCRSGFEKLGRISVERLVSVDAKLSHPPYGGWRISPRLIVLSAVAEAMAD